MVFDQLVADADGAIDAIVGVPVPACTEIV
jgi:hypothetical protein